MSTEENKAVVRRLFEEQIRHNLDFLEEALVPDYVHHDPALPPDVQRGRDNYRRDNEMFYTAFPDLEGTIEDMVAEGDKVATRLRWQGTHQAELMGIPPTGNRMDITMLTIHRIAEGKIVEGWANFDALGMMQQIGAIPPPEQAEA